MACAATAARRPAADHRNRAADLVITYADFPLGAVDATVVALAERLAITEIAPLSDLADPTQRVDDVSLRLRADMTPQAWRPATADAASRLCLPDVDDRALAGLKFSDALPHLVSRFRLPFPKLHIQFLQQSIHKIFPIP